MKKIDRRTNSDGKVEMIQFGEKAVTKDDFDAAVMVAGKGAYKDKTVQNILGLPNDIDLNSGKERIIAVDTVTKYSSSRKTIDTVTIDGKYTYDKKYYDSAVNAAGKGDYREKTLNDILGISNNIDVSDSNITYKRIDKSKIGYGKDVELKAKDSSQTDLYHISNKKRK